MGDDSYSIREMLERVESALRHDINRIHDKIDEYQKNTVTRLEFQAMQREVERVERVGEKDIETLKADLIETRRRDLTLVGIIFVIVEFALRYLGN